MRDEPVPPVKTIPMKPYILIDGNGMADSNGARYLTKTDADKVISEYSVGWTLCELKPIATRGNFFEERVVKF